MPVDDAEYDQDDVSEKGKKTQNRAAQRAFRERRQTQLSDLQARLQQYEQGEVERNVALQQLGKRLKEENDMLREENARLRAENDELKSRVEAFVRADAAAEHRPASTRRTSKRNRAAVSPPLRNRVKRLKVEHSPQAHPLSLDTTSAASSTSSNHISSPSVPIFDEDDVDMVVPRGYNPAEDNIGGQGKEFQSCGMCTSSIDCLCRQLGINTGSQIPTVESGTAETLSILDDLPPYQPPVPLRHRVKGPSFPVSDSKLTASTSHPKSERRPGGCTGDPSDCTACADNAFGKAFCSALGTSACGSASCTVCRSRGTSTSADVSGHASGTNTPLTLNPLLTQCCGRPGKCSGGACSMPDGINGKMKDIDLGSPSAAMEVDTDMPSDVANTVPCDVVWKTLEAHPNAHLVNPNMGPSHLANLNLLADVVARRSRCTLAPGEPTPEPEDFPARPRLRDTILEEADKPNNAATSRVQIDYEEEETSRPLLGRTLVPRNILQGHQRIVAVPREGVRDAIALLDRQFGCT